MKTPLNIPSIENAALAAGVAARWDFLTKPPGSLGQLETMGARYALIRGEVMPKLEKKAMYVFCGDHGVSAESVSPYPAEITLHMMRNYLRGGAAINVICRHYGIRTEVIDCGVNGDPVEGVIDRKIARGTRNFMREAAMTREQAEQALENGRALAHEAATRYDIAGIGEMGIGNTTAAAALLSVFCGIKPQESAGRGAGLDDEGVRRKARVIETALALHSPDAKDPVGVLAAVGGFEIAGMAGFLLGAAEVRLPVVVDGFIATSAALAANAIAPEVKQVLFFSHCSAEQAHHKMLAQLQGRAMFDLDMRLGEGSAAAIAIGLIDCSIKLYREMATFADLG